MVYVSCQAQVASYVALSYADGVASQGGDLIGIITVSRDMLCICISFCSMLGVLLDFLGDVLKEKGSLS